MNDTLTGHLKETGRDHWTLVVNLPAELRPGRDGVLRRVYPRSYRQVHARGIRRAEDELKTFIAEREQERYVDPERLTVAALCERWLAGKATLRPKSRAFYADNVRRHILPALAARRAASLSPSDLDGLYAKLGEGGLGATSVYHVHATLRAAFAWAVRNKLLTDNPARRLEKPPSPARRHIVVWDEATIARALYESDGHQRKPYRPQLVHVAVALGALAGLRPAESCGLRWGDIEGDLLHVQRVIEQADGVLHVCPPKSAAGERWVPLDPELARVLSAHKARQDEMRLAAGKRWNRAGYVLARVDGEPVRPDNLGSAFARFVRVHGLPEMTLHGLRHSFASNLFRAGGEGMLVVVQGLLGHERASTTADIYLHDDQAQRQDAMSGQAARTAAAKKALQDSRLIRDSVPDLQQARQRKSRK